MQRRYKILGLALNALLFIGAIVFLVYTVRKYETDLILSQLSSVPFDRFLLACVFSLLSYLVLSFYDLLALKYIEKPVSWKSVFYISFIANALSNSIGLAVLSGSSLRLRLYSSVGVTHIDILKVIAFYNLTFLIGFSSMAGILLVFFRPAFPASMELTGTSLKLLGLGLLLFSCVYLLMSSRSVEYFKLGKWTVKLPPLNYSLAQMVAAIADWVITGAILYFLIPEGTIPFHIFTGIFLTAHIAGTASNIPGGLGVFEALLLLMLSPFMPEPHIIGAILLYRVVYYLVPLALGVAMFCAQELLHKKHDWLALATTKDAEK